MREQPTLLEQTTYFDRWNTKYRNVSFKEIEPESKARADTVLRILRSVPVTRPLILEIGCGTGWFTERLVTFGPVMGIDLSPRAIEIANRRAIDAEFVAADFFQHDFLPEHFDVAVCLETIAYVSDQARFVEKLASALKPGGYLLLTSVNKFVYERRSDIGPPEPGQIRKWLSRKEIKKLLNPRFHVRHMTTVLPKGDMGLLRIVHSYKVNWLLSRVFSRDTIARIQEKLGLGHTWVVLAQRRGPFGEKASFFKVTNRGRTLPR